MHSKDSTVASILAVNSLQHLCSLHIRWSPVKMSLMNLYAFPPSGSEHPELTMSAADMFLESCPNLTRLMDLRSWVRKQDYISNNFMHAIGWSLSKGDWRTGGKDWSWRLGPLYWKGLRPGKTWKQIDQWWNKSADFRWQNKHWKGQAWRRSMTSWGTNLGTWLWFHDNDTFHPWIFGFTKQKYICFW